MFKRTAKLKRIAAASTAALLAVSLLPAAAFGTYEAAPVVPDEMEKSEGTDQNEGADTGISEEDVKGESRSVHWSINYPAELLTIWHDNFMNSFIDVKVRTHDDGEWQICDPSFQLTEALDDPAWDGMINVIGIGRYSGVHYFSISISINGRALTDNVQYSEADASGFGSIYLRAGQQWKTLEDETWNTAFDPCDISVPAGVYMVRNAAVDGHFATFPLYIEIPEYVKPDPPVDPNPPVDPDPDNPDPVDPKPPVDPDPDNPDPPINPDPDNPDNPDPIDPTPQIPSSPSEVRTPSVATAYIETKIGTSKESWTIPSESTANVDLSNEKEFKSFVSNWVSAVVANLGFDGVAHEVSEVRVTKELIHGTPQNPEGQNGEFECDVVFTPEQGPKARTANTLAKRYSATVDTAASIAMLSADGSLDSAGKRSDSSGTDVNDQNGVGENPEKDGQTASVDNTPSTLTLNGAIAAKPYKATPSVGDDGSGKPNHGNGTGNGSNGGSGVGDHPLASTNGNQKPASNTTPQANSSNLALKSPTAVSSLRTMSTTENKSVMQEVKIPYSIENVQSDALPENVEGEIGPIQHITTSVYSYSTGNPALSAILGPYGIGALVIVAIVGAAVVGFMVQQKRTLPKDEN